MEPTGLPRSKMLFRKFLTSKETQTATAAAFGGDRWYDVKTDKIKVHPKTKNTSEVYGEFCSENRVFGKTKKLLSVKTNIHKDKVRFVCVSDTHGQLGKILDKIPPGDVLIHAGDFSTLGYPGEVKKFDEEMEKLPHRWKIVIAGNHELSFDRGTDSSFLHSELGKIGVSNPRNLLKSCIYLEDSAVTAFGYKIYGSPWQPTFRSWAFNLERGQKILEKWDKIPKDTDILVTHGPPLGHGDYAKMEVRAGCVELLNTVEKRVKPKYHIFGHIHEGYGATTNGETIFVNCSICTVRYNPTNEPVIFDLPLLPGIRKNAETLKFRELCTIC